MKSLFYVFFSLLFIVYFDKKKVIKNATGKKKKIEIKLKLSMVNSMDCMNRNKFQS